MQNNPRLTVRLAAVAEMLNVSTSTVRRRVKDDPDFPKPFRMVETAEWLWSVQSLERYVEMKAAQAQAEAQAA